MEDQNKVLAKKEKKKLFIIIAVLSLIVLVLGGYICYDKVLKKDNIAEQTEKKPKKSSDKKINEPSDNTQADDSGTYSNIVTDFDYDGLAKSLHEAVKQDNITTFVRHCKEIPQENQISKTEETDVKVSIDTIDTIVAKLKTAEEVERTTMDWFGCPPRLVSYYVGVSTTNQEEFGKGRIFSLHYPHDGYSLMIGYNHDGYAFNYKTAEDIEGFIEGLK